MHLIAFRPEYQITLDPLKNRIFFKLFAEVNTAQELPHYLADWTQALDQVQAGFTILTDITQLAENNRALFEAYVAAQSLIVARGVGMVAEVHQPGASTEAASEQVSGRSTMPVRRFVDLWEADQYLDRL